jgi:hypothetical protein
MVMNVNAFTLGITQGYINHFLLTKRYSLNPDSPELAIL